MEEFCTNKAKEIKEHLKSSGENNYNNYNKSAFKRKAESFTALSDEDTKVKILNNNMFDSLKSKIQETPKGRITKVASVEAGLENLFSETKSLLKITVVSKTLDELKGSHRLSEWIRQGLDIHKKNDIYQKICAFCKGSLNEKRLKDIENHFNDNYNQFESAIKNLLSKITITIDNLDSLNNKGFPHEKEFYGDIEKSYVIQRDLLKESIRDTVHWLKSLKKDLESKKGKLFESVNITTQEPTDISISVADINSIIDEHNKQTEKFTERIENDRYELEEHFVADTLKGYKSKKDSISASSIEIERMKKEKDKINKEKLDIEKSIENTTQAAEELNKDLASFLGRDEIKFTSEGGGYAITRNDCPAKDLSEGERTALAFLHFLKSLSGKGFDLENGIVVIDDPISSLDSNAIYSAFSFMKNKTEAAGQLFIMTHNFSFFKEVRRWFEEGKKEDKKDFSLYMLKYEFAEKERVAKISKLDHLLRKFSSEYHFLFSMVYKAQTEEELTQLYPMPNIARKLLEEFFYFKDPRSVGLHKKMKNVSLSNLDIDVDKIIRFANTNSHANKIGDTEDLSVFQQLPSVMREIMKLLKEVDKDHFRNMKSIIQPKS